MELRASGERAVLTGHDGARELEVDPGTLPLGGELTSALQQWAQVVGAVLRIEGDADRETAASVVTGRGRQLAGRVAAALGVPVGYRDPLTGELSVMDPPAVTGKPAASGAEPTPWSTGLVVAAFSAIVVLVAVASLAGTLEETSPLLALGANLVVTAGLLPSVWLARAVPTWRWIALGVAVGIGLSWFVLAFLLL